MKVCPRCRASHPDEFAFCPRDATPLVDVEPWSFGSLHGGYQILDAIEGDGPGERFRALHRESGERRIVRALEGWWLASAPYAERFRQEIARAPLLDHPHAARVEGLFEPPGDRPYVVEEEIWGPSLRQVLDAVARPVAFPWVCLVAHQLAGALEAAHALGLVHGEIRPRDVVFPDAVEPMEIKVLGFGIGALRDSDERNGAPLAAARGEAPSPYASPERLPMTLGSDGGEVPDPRSDLYSLGVLLYEILTGRLPPRPARGPGPLPVATAAGRPVPPPLARLVGRLLEPDSERRPRSAREVLAALTAAEEEMRRSSPGFLWEPGAALLGRYRLLAEPLRDEVLERFPARDLAAGRRVSVVALAQHLAAVPELAAFFRGQAAVVAALQHENLDNVLAAGEGEGGRPFLVEEDVRGMPLSWVAAGRAPIDLARGCRILAGVARGLEALHRYGLCHGCLTAESVLLVDTPFGERARLLHIWERPVRAAWEALRAEDPDAPLPPLPAYLAPEVLAGEGDDPAGQTDLYALGVLAWEILARRPPCRGMPAPPLSTAFPEAPPGLDALVARLLEKVPGRRPASGEAAEALERLAADVAPPAAPLRPSPSPLLGRPAPVPVTVPAAGPRALVGEVGSVIAGRFRVERRLGGGGIGQVFAVTAMDDGGRWALKLLRRERLGAVPAERIVRAVEPLIRLRHPGVAAVREVGEAEDGSPFLVCEVVAGPDLLELTFPLSLATICATAREIAEALGALHAAGVIHGDLKPRHARLAPSPAGRRWRLLDAGLAPALAGLLPGVAVGTPGYLAPERMRGSAILDPRSDLYSLGVVLHELLSGRLPDGSRPPLVSLGTGGRVPERLQLLVLRLVEQDPRWRPADAREVLDELAAVEADLRAAEEPGEITAVFRSPLVRPAERTRRLAAARGLQTQKTDAQAEISYRAALLGDRENPFLHAFLGRALARQGRWGEAVTAFREALRRDPACGPVYGRLHEALLAVGDAAGARAVRAAGHAAWWRLASPACRRIDGHAATVVSVAFSHDGACLASAGAEGALRLWSRRAGSAERVLYGHDGGVQAVACSPAGPVAASAGRDGTVRLWDTAGGALLATLTGHSQAVRAVAFSRDGQAVASGSAAGEVRIWGTADGRERAVYRFRSPINAVDCGPDGTVLHGSVEGTVEIVGLDPPAPLLTVRAHGEPVTAAAFSPDGGLVASGSVDRTVKLWDAATGELVATLRGHTAAVSAVVFLPGGLLLASAGFDATVRLWDLFEGKLRDTFPAEAGFLTSLAVSPDGGALAAGTDLRWIELWEEAG